MEGKLKRIGDMDEKEIKNIIRQITENGLEGLSGDVIFSLIKGDIPPKYLNFLIGVISGKAASERDKALDKEKTMKTKEIDKMRGINKRTLDYRLGMSLITSVIGVIFLIISVIIGLTEKEFLVTIVFGGLGITSIISSLIFRPDKTAADATRDMMRQKIALDTWFQGSTPIAHSMEPEKTYGTYGETALALLHQFQSIDTKDDTDKMLIATLEVGLGFSVTIETVEQMESAIATLRDLAVTCSSLIEGTTDS